MVNPIDLTPLERAVKGAVPMDQNGSDLLQILKESRDLLRDLVEHRHTPRILVWPRDGGTGFMTAGENLFDFENGIFTPADDNGEEQMSGQGIVRSVHFHMFGMSDMSVELIPPLNKSGFGVQSTFMDYQHHVLSHAEIARIKVWTTLPIGLYVQASESPEAPPIAPIGDVAPQGWSFDGVTSTDSFVAVIMRPRSLVPRTNAASVLSAARAQDDTDGILLQSAQCLYSFYLPNLTWVIRNTGSNGVDINLQGAPSGNSSNYTDDPETGPGILLPSGDTLVLKPSRVYVFQRIRVRSAVAGSSTTLAGEVVGQVGF